jgi:hypothetical protein
VGAASIELVHSPRALWRRTTRGMLLLTDAIHEPRALAGTAAALWECFAEARTPDEAAERLAVSFGIGVERARSEIAPVVDDLVALGALVRADTT